MVEPKTAIACRDETELAVVLGVLNYEGHRTDFLEDMNVPIRIYVCPEEYKYGDDNDACPYDDLTYNIGNNVDDFEHIDNCDPFEWNYVEASDIFHNHIISARIKED
jgi:hypothetical protein